MIGQHRASDRSPLPARQTVAAARRSMIRPRFPVDQTLNRIVSSWSQHGSARAGVQQSGDGWRDGEKVAGLSTLAIRRTVIETVGEDQCTLPGIVPNGGDTVRQTVRRPDGRGRWGRKRSGSPDARPPSHCLGATDGSPITGRSTGRLVIVPGRSLRTNSPVGQTVIRIACR
jgi:hypothetical protein